MSKQKSGKKNRKHDRNKPWCESYRSRNQREINKAVKIARHIRTHPSDIAAKETFRELPSKARKGHGEIGTS